MLIDAADAGLTALPPAPVLVHLHRKIRRCSRGRGHPRVKTGFSGGTSYQWLFLSSRCSLQWISTTRRSLLQRTAIFAAPRWREIASPNGYACLPGRLTACRPEPDAAGWPRAGLGFAVNQIIRRADNAADKGVAQQRAFHQAVGFGHHRRQNHVVY